MVSYPRSSGPRERLHRGGHLKTITCGGRGRPRCRTGRQNTSYRSFGVLQSRTSAQTNPTPDPRPDPWGGARGRRGQSCGSAACFSGVLPKPNPGGRKASLDQPSKRPAWVFFPVGPAVRSSQLALTAGRAAKKRPAYRLVSSPKDLIARIFGAVGCSCVRATNQLARSTCRTGRRKTSCRSFGQLA